MLFLAIIGTTAFYILHPDNTADPAIFLTNINIDAVYGLSES